MINTKTILGMNWGLPRNAQAVLSTKETWRARELVEQLVSTGYISHKRLFELFDKINLFSETQWLTIHCRWILWLHKRRERSGKKPIWSLNRAARQAGDYLNNCEHDLQEVKDCVGEIWVGRSMELMRKSHTVQHEILPFVLAEADNLGI